MIMPVVIMISFARSGGTLLNRCLGSLPNVVIMSEVNPLGGGWGRGPIQFDTVKAQAENWYGIRLTSDTFHESVLELEKICRERDKRLILRDWTFVNFIPYEYNNWNPPQKLLILETLQDRVNLKPFAFVRDSIDVWISKGLPPVEEFFPHYLRYVKTILDEGIPIFKYEHFCQQPRKLMRQICDCTGLVFSDDYKNYSKFINVNGDVQDTGGSRGMRQKKIRPLPRKRISKDKIQELENCTEMIEANNLLGYAHKYLDVHLESKFKKDLMDEKEKMTQFVKSKLFGK